MPGYVENTRCVKSPTFSWTKETMFSYTEDSLRDWLCQRPPQQSINISPVKCIMNYLWKCGRVRFIAFVVKNYIPDFVVEGTITEVKGYKTEQWLAKLEANPNVQVLYEKDLEPVLEYVKNKYGKDFINLYE